MELETLEDFKKAAENLQDKNAKDFQYRIRWFGFCTHCEGITEYDFQDAIDKGWFVTCFSCGDSFGGYGNNTRKDSEYLTGDMIPLKYRKEIERLHSRKQQTLFLHGALVKIITNKQEEFKKLGSDINQLESIMVKIL